MIPESAPIDVVNELEDMEIYDYEPSAEEEEEEDVTEDTQEVTGCSQDLVMSNGDCVPPEFTFSACGAEGAAGCGPLLTMHGFPIYRFHADKGEFFNHAFRSWLRDQGLYCTWSEPGVPQGNGQAESLVRWMKDGTRTLLRSADLPARLWPVAAAAAAAQQQASVLGWRSLLAAPFGATVHLKRKAFDRTGHNDENKVWNPNG